MVLIKQKNTNGMVKQKAIDKLIYLWDEDLQVRSSHPTNLTLQLLFFTSSHSHTLKSCAKPSQKSGVLAAKGEITPYLCSKILKGMPNKIKYVWWANVTTKFWLYSTLKANALE